MINIKNAQGNTITGFRLAIGETLEIEIEAVEALAELKVCANKANFYETKLSDESDITAMSNGLEVLSAVEGRILPAGSFQKIDGFANSLEAGSIGQESSISIELRLDESEISETIGEVAISLAFRVQEA